MIPTQASQIASAFVGDVGHTAAAVIDCCLLMTSHSFALLVGVYRSNVNTALADAGYGM